MNTTEALNISSLIIQKYPTEPDKLYWLCIQSRRLVCFPEKELPTDVIKVFHFNNKIATQGLSSGEWNRLDATLTEFTRGGLL